MTGLAVSLASVFDGTLVVLIMRQAAIKRHVVVGLFIAIPLLVFHSSFRS
jgi:hypothetical protein